MFSTPNSALVSHSDGMFTCYSASTNYTNEDFENDLIALLSIVQTYNVDYVPFTWQPALGTLGEGGSGTVNQSTFIRDMPLAFKRFHDSENPDQDLLPLISEVLILSQPPIQNHPNIVSLTGICWEIKPRTEKVVPVLVFEKATWDLQQFRNVHEEGMNMLFEDRLKFCADIGSAIMTLHAYDVIHGDIKPQNVLVFKNTFGKATVKVADFGYSTLAVGEAGNVFLPKSRPWNAPEHHFGEFKVPEAKKTDVYSFGLLCLWVLFGTVRIPQNTTLCTFDGSTGPRTSLEHLKDEDKVEDFAKHLMESVQLASFNNEHRTRLKEFFSLTVPLNPEKRTSNLSRLVGLLSHERTEPPPPTPRTLDKLSRHPDFRIAERLGDLMLADYRVRTEIRDSLEKNYLRNQTQPFAAHIAFQIAFAYQIGFGAKSDTNESQKWLEKSNKIPQDLVDEKQAVQPARWKNMRMWGLEGLVLVDLIHEYRTWGLAKLEQACQEYEREGRDMAREFGELHFIPLKLYETVGNQLDELGEFAKSKALRIRIRDQIKNASGKGHPYYIRSILNVFNSYARLGEWMEAQLAQEDLLKHVECTDGSQNLTVMSIKSNLAFIYGEQGRWKEAEQLYIQVIETETKLLGQEHPETLISMGNLASIFTDQGRWKEAAELFMQVMETETRILGQMHPDTLTSTTNLASTYRNLGRWKDAEMLIVQVMDTEKMVLGHEHPSTLTRMANLALIYNSQGRWKEAAELEVQVMVIRKKVLGHEHPSTLKSMSSLASTYGKQGRLEEAEQLIVQVMEMKKRLLGQEHPDTLISMNNLASTYRKQGRWKEAAELFEQVIQTKRRVLGQEHPNTLITMGNLASTYRNQGRWKEAEEMEVQVMEIRKKVLGQENPDTLTSMSNLASTFAKQGRWKEAEELFVQVVKTEKRILGQEHPHTLTSVTNLAFTYRNQGRWKEAEVLEVQVVEAEKRVLGHEHLSTLISMNNLASTYRNQGRWKEAEEVYVQVLETRKRLLGQDHPDTLASLANLAVVFCDQGRGKEAEELEVQVMEMSKRVLGQGHPDTLLSMNNLVVTYLDQGRLEEAEELQLQVTYQTRTTLGEDHPFTVITIANLASIHKKREELRHLSDENKLEYGLREVPKEFSIKLEDSETNEQRCQRTHTTSMVDDNDNEEIGCSKGADSPKVEGPYIELHNVGEGSRGTVSIVIPLELEKVAAPLDGLDKESRSVEGIDRPVSN